MGEEYAFLATVCRILVPLSWESQMAKGTARKIGGFYTVYITSLLCFMFKHTHTHIYSNCYRALTYKLARKFLPSTICSRRVLFSNSYGKYPKYRQGVFCLVSWEPVIRWLYLSLSDGNGPSLEYAPDFVINIHIPMCFWWLVWHPVVWVNLVKIAME